MLGMPLLLFLRVSVWNCLQSKKTVNKKVIMPRCIPPREVSRCLLINLRRNMLIAFSVAESETHRVIRASRESAGFPTSVK